ncbi:1-phosphofructokinase family hexose kinase [Rhizobium sp. L1K21]|uniref:1-phosphofructokinase family hexose kinase n=1 Tax=Rhizobium sp. L1K21 TaxID=2954933 RepID=UPI002092072C|nr:1-phosphofructokinase family hexose kinase [Rhizobium sp. L1K21]MCO6186456.1 1-phosphofructokinase family hexose kinase [Rhizobium sp. L1K21]
MNILCVALNPTIDISCTAKRVEPTHKIRTRGQSLHAGGGGVNVARVVKTLGGDPKLLITSGGVAGTLLEEALGESGIRLDVIELKEPTRIAYAVFDEESGLEYRFVPEGPDVPRAKQQQIARAVGECRNGFVVASGSLPRGVPDDIYAQLARIAAENKSRFILDTSGAALKAALDARENIFLVKPSLSELEAYIGLKLDEQAATEAATALVRDGKAQHVALTLGGDGALLAGPGGVLRLPAIKVEVKSATGAGDSFVAGLVWRLSEGDALEQAFRYAMAVGAATAMTPGTELCHREDVENLLKQLPA